MATNDLLTTLRREAATGFPAFAGARVHAAVPLTQVLLNEVLRRVEGVPPGLVLDVQPGNRLVVRYGLVHATAALDPDALVGDGPPKILLELDSTMIAWTLSKAVAVKGVDISGRRVTIDLGALDRLTPYRDYWRHIERLRLQTTAGVVHLDVEAAVR